MMMRMWKQWYSCCYKPFPNPSLFLPRNSNNKTAHEMLKDQMQNKNSSSKHVRLLHMLEPGATVSVGDTSYNLTRVVQTLVPTRSTRYVHLCKALVCVSLSFGKAVMYSHLRLFYSTTSRRRPYSKSTDATPHSRPTKLVQALVAQQWQDVLKRLVKKPHEAAVWTMLDSGPPCHLLPLHIALRDKTTPLAVIQALIQANPQALGMREWYGMLPLHIACQVGAPLEIVQLLTRDYPQADLTGLLPLHLACLADACRQDVILHLLELYPASIYQKDSKGFVARDYIANSGHPHCKVLLQELDRGADYWGAAVSNTLVELLYDGQWEKAHARVQTDSEEASVWIKSSGTRQYALHVACSTKAPSHVVEALVTAYPEALRIPIGDYQLLPLHLACQHGASFPVVSILLQHYKEAASVTDTLGLLPLHLSITEGASVSVVQALLEAFPQAVQMQDKRGYTPMFYAESSFHPNRKKVQEMLLGETTSGCGTTRPAEESFSRPQTKRQKSDRSITATSA